MLEIVHFKRKMARRVWRMEGNSLERNGKKVFGCFLGFFGMLRRPLEFLSLEFCLGLEVSRNLRLISIMVLSSISFWIIGGGTHKSKWSNLWER